MKIQCPQCGVLGSVNELYRGRRVKCPKCDHVFAFDEEPAGTPALATPEEPLSPSEEWSTDDADAALASSSQKPPVDDPLLPPLPDDRSDDSLLTAESKLAAADDAPGEVGGTFQPPAMEEGQDLPVTDDETPAANAALTSGASLPGEEERGAGGDTGSVLEEREEPASVAPALAETAEATVQEEVAQPSSAAVIPAMEQAAAVAEPTSAEPPPPPEPAAIAMAAAAAVAAAGQGGDKASLEGVEQQPYGVDKEQCWQCGKKDSVGVPFIAKDGRLYCPGCLPADKEEAAGAGEAPPQGLAGVSISALVGEAWEKTRGVKGPIWAGSAVMYAVMLIVFAGASWLLPQPGGGMGMAGMGADFLLQMCSNAVMAIFFAGIVNMGIRRVAGRQVGWRMVLDGLPIAGKLAVAGILQSLLIMIGFFLLILPGIYLTVGYSMTLPLIIDRGMSPWEAMEASRKAVHKEWWKIFALFLVMGLLLLLATLPFGLGLIWVWPMTVLLGALVYRALFGIDKAAV